MARDFDINDDERARYEANMEIAREMLSGKSDATKALEDSTEANLMLAQQFEELRIATDEEREVLAEHTRVMQELFGKKGVQSPDFSLGYEDDTFVYSPGKPRTAQEAGAQAELREYDEKSLELLEAIRDNTARLALADTRTKAQDMKRGAKVGTAKKAAMGLGTLIQRYAMGIIGMGVKGWATAWKVIGPEVEKLGKWIADTGRKIYDGVVRIYDGLLDASEWVADAIPRAWNTIKEGIGYIGDQFVFAGNKIRDGAIFIFTKIKDAWDSVKAWFGFGPEKPIRGTSRILPEFYIEEIQKLGKPRHKTKAEIGAGFDPWRSIEPTKYTHPGGELPTAGITSAQFKDMQRDWKQERPQRDKIQRAEAYEQKAQQGLVAESAEVVRESVAATQALTKGMKNFMEMMDKRFDRSSITSGDTGISMHAIPSISPDADLRGLSF